MLKSNPTQQEIEMVTLDSLVPRDHLVRFGIRGERQLMRDVEVNVAYRWFRCRLFD